MFCCKYKSVTRNFFTNTETLGELSNRAVSDDIDGRMRHLWLLDVERDSANIQRRQCKGNQNANVFITDITELNQIILLCHQTNAKIAASIKTYQPRESIPLVPKTDNIPHPWPAV